MVITTPSRKSRLHHTRSEYYLLLHVCQGSLDHHRNLFRHQSYAKTVIYIQEIKTESNIIFFDLREQIYHCCSLCLGCYRNATKVYMPRQYCTLVRALLYFKSQVCRECILPRTLVNIASSSHLRDLVTTVPRRHLYAEIVYLVPLLLHLSGIQLDCTLYPSEVQSSLYTRRP